MKRAGLEEKDYLNPEEAIAYWGLSRRKFLTLIRSGPQPFIVMYGNRRLIVRYEFERYLNQPGRKEALLNGKVGNCRRKTQGQETQGSSVG